MKAFIQEISTSIGDILSKLITYFVYLLLTYVLVLLTFILFHISKSALLFEFSVPSICATVFFCLIVTFKEKKVLFTREQVNTIKNYWIELLVGFLLPVFIVLLIKLVDRYSSLSLNFDIKAFYYLPFFFLFATFEEVLFRFALLGSPKTKGKFNTKVILSSIIFSLFHITNNGYDLVAFALIFVSSMIISFVYIATEKNLLLVSLIHTIWNFCSGSVIGGEVSGLPVQHTLIKLVRTKDNIVNGGSFGIEGSIISLIILTFILLGYTTFNNWFKKNIKFSTKNHSSGTCG